MQKEIGHRNRKQKYGITTDQFTQLLQKQNNVCAICSKPEIETHYKGKPMDLAVDHCHKTNRIRGLLCGKCNKALGLLLDQPRLLISAIKYLIQADFDHAMELIARVKG